MMPAGLRLLWLMGWLLHFAILPKQSVDALTYRVPRVGVHELGEHDEKEGEETGWDSEDEEDGETETGLGPELKEGK